MTPDESQQELENILVECSVYEACMLLQTERVFNPGRINTMEHEYYNSNISARDFLENYLNTDFEGVARAIITIANLI